MRIRHDERRKGKVGQEQIADRTLNWYGVRRHFVGRWSDDRLTLGENAAFTIGRLRNTPLLVHRTASRVATATRGVRRAHRHWREKLHGDSERHDATQGRAQRFAYCHAFRLPDPVLPHERSTD
jgi:hypothetical protein